MSTSAAKLGTIPSLTGLRFIAALMVFFSHFPIPGTGGSLLIFQQSGYAGVTFFFVLSGFIIALNYLDSFEKNTTSNIFSYLVSRFARIYPLYAFCILFVWISRGANGDIATFLLATQAWSDDYWTAFGLVSQSWSISVEFFLYLTFPLIIPALKHLKVISSKNRLMVFFFAMVATQFALAYYFSASGRAALPVTDPDSAHRWLYRMPITRIFDFAIGISAAIYYKRHLRHGANTDKLSKLATYMSAAAIILLMSSDKVFLTAYSYDAIYSMPFIILILSLAISRETIISKLLSTPKMVLLGEASFAMYLLQAMISTIYIQQPESSVIFSAVNEAFYLAILIATSIGLHAMLEKPGQKFIRKIAGLNKSKQISAQTSSKAKTLDGELVAACEAHTTSKNELVKQ